MQNIVDTIRGVDQMSDRHAFNDRLRGLTINDMRFLMDAASQHPAHNFELHAATMEQLAMNEATRKNRYRLPPEMFEQMGMLFVNDGFYPQ